MAFEFQGEHHYLDANVMFKDLVKLNECKNTNIILIPVNICQLNNEKLSVLILNSIKDQVGLNKIVNDLDFEEYKNVGNSKMKIRRNSLSDRDTILKLYAQTRGFMESNGNPNQWDKNYPEISLIEQDIKSKKSKNSYVCVDDSEIVGTFFYVEDADQTYEKIDQTEWQKDEPYSVVYRIASANGKRGVATFCLDCCFKKCGNVRIAFQKIVKQS